MNVVIIDVNNEMIELINENYVEGKTDNYKYVYTKTFIKWYAELYPSVVMGIYENNILIATIIGRVVPTVLNNNHVNLAEISFLCVHKTYRNNGLCPLLISSVEDKMQDLGATDAIFSTHHNMGKPLCGINHMMRIINVRKIVSVGYLRCDTHIDTLAEYYKIDPVKIKNKKLEKITHSNIEQAYNVYNKWYRNMDIYTNYTLPVFTQVMLSDNIISYVMLDNNVIVDMISYYVVASCVTRRKVSMVDAYIYHYTNNRNCVHRLISLLLHYEGHKLDTITIPQTMNICCNDFEDLKFVSTTCGYNYYLFKNKELTINANNMGIMLL